MDKDQIKNIAEKIGIPEKQFMEECIDGNIFVFNWATLYDFFKEAELETDFLEWVKKEIESKQLHTIDNLHFFMTS